MVLEADKSNSFSLGLIVVFLAYANLPLDLNDIYNHEVISINMHMLKKLINDLEKQGFSTLFTHVLLDLTSEFEHIRLSPKNFMKSLGHHRNNLESDLYTEQNNLLTGYQEFNNFSENYELNGKMSHAFGFESAEDYHTQENVNSEDVVRKLKGISQPFTPQNMEMDNSF